MAPHVYGCDFETFEGGKGSERARLRLIELAAHFLRIVIFMTRTQRLYCVVVPF